MYTYDYDIPTVNRLIAFAMGEDLKRTGVDIKKYYVFILSFNNLLSNFNVVYNEFLRVL